MKYFSAVVVLVTILFCSCETANYPKADNELVAAQSFLDACMKGDFKQANFYMVQDSVNNSYLDKMKNAYYQYDADKRESYRSANIIIQNNEAIDTNTKIISYQNSLDKNNQKLKAVNQNGDWKIDLKYTFSGNL
ncbi:MAG: hypothetical protein PW786_08205 [Arachidicoccus sp.]|nr:hypothetical protein [Arachidicoccus sp.]